MDGGTLDSGRLQTGCNFLSQNFDPALYLVKGPAVPIQLKQRPVVLEQPMLPQDLLRDRLRVADKQGPLDPDLLLVVLPRHGARGKPVP
jgi:hypothetical protein